MKTATMIILVFAVVGLVGLGLSGYGYSKYQGARAEALEYSGKAADYQLKVVTGEGSSKFDKDHNATMAGLTQSIHQKAESASAHYLGVMYLGSGLMSVCILFFVIFGAMKAAGK